MRESVGVCGVGGWVRACVCVRARDRGRETKGGGGGVVKLQS